MCTPAPATPDLSTLETFVWIWNVSVSLHRNPDSYIQLPTWHLFDICHLKLNVIWSLPPDPEPAPSTLSLISEDGISGLLFAQV